MCENVELLPHNRFLLTGTGLSLCVHVQIS